MRPIFYSLILGLNIALASHSLAQGKAVPIHICLKYETKPDASGQPVRESIDNGDKIKGLLYQTTRTDITCRNLASAPSDLKIHNVTLKIHGQSSQTYLQKSYGLEIVDKDYKSLAKEQQIQFAGLPRGEKFILTSNYIDRSNLRNPLAYSIAAQMGRGAHGTDGKPDYFGTYFTFADVRVDGDFKGLYTLSARVERSKERLDIAKVNDEHFEDFDWIGEICTGVKDADYHSKRKTFIAFQYPEAKDLDKFKDKTKGESAKQKMIRDIERFEDVLAGPRFADPETGYAAFIDVDNFIDFIILQEFAKNVDGLRRSAWFRHVDGKFKMGPVWDFDAAFGNLIMYEMPLTSGWLLDFGQDTWYSRGGFEQFPAAFWFRRLVEDPAFANRLKARYRGLRMPGGILTDDSIAATLERLTKDIGDSGQKTERRWSGTHTNPLHSLIFRTASYDRSYDGSRATLSKWITKRLKWLDENIGSIERRR